MRIGSSWPGDGLAEPPPETIVSAVNLPMLQVSVTAELLSALASVTRTQEVCRNLDLDLFDLGLLDSLGMVEMLVFISDRFGTDISPAEIERDHWATPRLILEFVETHLQP